MPTGVRHAVQTVLSELNASWSIRGCGEVHHWDGGEWEVDGGDMVRVNVHKNKGISKLGVAGRII